MAAEGGPWERPRGGASMGAGTQEAQAVKPKEGAKEEGSEEGKMGGRCSKPTKGREQQVCGSGRRRLPVRAALGDAHAAGTPQQHTSSASLPGTRSRDSRRPDRLHDLRGLPGGPAPPEAAGPQLAPPEPWQRTTVKCSAPDAAVVAAGSGGGGGSGIPSTSLQLEAPWEVGSGPPHLPEHSARNPRSGLRSILARRPRAQV